MDERLLALARAAFPPSQLRDTGGLCDLDILRGQAQEQHFLGGGSGGGNGSLPVLLKGPLRGEWARSWDPGKLAAALGSYRAWHRNVSGAIRAQYGHAELRAVGYVDGSQDGSRHTRALQDVLADMQALRSAATADVDSVFDVSGRGIAAAMAAFVPPIPSAMAASPWLAAAPWRPSFSLAPPGRGLALHSHGAAWQAVLGGAKLWVLGAPSLSGVDVRGGEVDGEVPPTWAVSPSAEWVPALLMRRAARIVSRDSSSSGDISINSIDAAAAPAAPGVGAGTDFPDPDAALSLCVVEAGDVIYVPDAWHHATFKLGVTLAVGGQLGMEAYSTQQLRAALQRCVNGSVDQ